MARQIKKHFVNNACVNGTLRFHTFIHELLDFMSPQLATRAMKIVVKDNLSC